MGAGGTAFWWAAGNRGNLDNRLAGARNTEVPLERNGRSPVSAVWRKTNEQQVKPLRIFKFIPKCNLKSEFELSRARRSSHLSRPKGDTFGLEFQIDLFAGF
jgi:hypothetical protein